MIQRIQSIYLSLTTLLSILLFNRSFLNFIDKTGSAIKITFNGIVKNSGVSGVELIDKPFILSIIIILIPLLSLITIFIFKNRMIQLRLTLTLILLIVGLISVSLYYSLKIVTEYQARFVPGLNLLIPVLMMIFAILAYIGIRKDDLLVKSYDRLR
jgi:hypothetical protein